MSESWSKESKLTTESKENDSERKSSSTQVNASMQVDKNYGIVAAIVKYFNIPRWFFISFLAAFILLTTIFIVIVGVNTLKTDNPFYVLWAYHPPTEGCDQPMDKRLNIAIADFKQSDHNVGRTLLAELKKTLPEKTGIPAEDIELRQLPFISTEEEAQTLGQCHHATMVIWAEQGHDRPIPHLKVVEPHEGYDEAIPIQALVPDTESDYQVRIQLDLYAQALSLFIAGLTHLYVDEYREAAQYFEQAIGVTQEYVETPQQRDLILAVLYFYKGRSLSGAGEVTGALDDYHTCLRLNNAYVWAYIGIGNIHYGRGVQQPLDRRELDYALEQYQNVIDTYALHLRNQPHAGGTSTRRFSAAGSGRRRSGPAV